MINNCPVVEHGGVCLFSETETFSTHVSANCVCTCDEDGFIYRRMPHSVIGNVRVRLTAVDCNLLSVECLLPPAPYLVSWQDTISSKGGAMQFFGKLVHFFEQTHATVGYWPDIEYFGDLVVVSGGAHSGSIRFLRPVKFTSRKLYLIGLRTLFLKLCSFTANKIECTMDGVQTGKGVNAKFCKYYMFKRRPPPFLKNLQESACRGGDGPCPHEGYIDSFNRTDDKTGFVLPQSDALQHHFACPKTLDMYVDCGVEFTCRLFPEARSFFAELGRSDKIHTIFCYPDELLDDHWFEGFWALINQYRTVLDKSYSEFI